LERFSTGRTSTQGTGCRQRRKKGYPLIKKVAQLGNATEAA
jgi:hypothetical protein